MKKKKLLLYFGRNIGNGIHIFRIFGNISSESY